MSIISHEDFVSFEQAVKLKKLGFDWKCYTFYHLDNWGGLCHSGICENHNMFKKCISAPTLSQAKKWLREVKGILVQPIYDYFLKKWFFNIGRMPDHSIESTKAEFDFEGAALSSGIDRALELLKSL